MVFILSKISILEMFDDAEMIEIDVNKQHNNDYIVKLTSESGKTKTIITQYPVKFLQV